MSAPKTPAAVDDDTAAAAGATDATDLAGIFADDADMEARRRSIAARHVMDVGGPLMLALARMAALTDQMAVEARFIRNHIEGAR